MYIDEIDFSKKYKGLRRVAPTTFKYLCFKFFKNANSFNLEEGKHVAILPTGKEFASIYGNIELHYSVKNKKVIIENLKPEGIFLANYTSDLKIYKGIPYVNEKDKFKIDMYKKIGGM